MSLSEQVAELEKENVSLKRQNKKLIAQVEDEQRANLIYKNTFDTFSTLLKQAHKLVGKLEE